MSIEDVRVHWNQFRVQTLVIFTGINRPDQLEDVEANIGRFPNRLRDRNEWLHACLFIMNLERTVQVTDAALRQENAFVATSNEIAAKITLPAPQVSDINSLLDTLNIVNRRIQQDQRFAAAVRVGLALADEIGERLKK
jgi:hypothetical protein